MVYCSKDNDQNLFDVLNTLRACITCLCSGGTSNKCPRSLAFRVNDFIGSFYMTDFLKENIFNLAHTTIPHKLFGTKQGKQAKVDSAFDIYFPIPFDGYYQNFISGKETNH